MSQNNPVNYPVVGSVFIPQGSSGGGNIVQGDGCTATGQGQLGSFQIDLTEASCLNDTSDIAIVCTPASGSNVAGGVSYGISQLGGGVLGGFIVSQYKVADQSRIDTPYRVTVQKRTPGFRQGI